MPMQVILLEHVDSLGNLGDVVKVKPGYARNYLIPQKKALRATPGNVAYFESQKKEIEKQNEVRRKEAEKDSKKLEKFSITIIRHASESGQLYGSVSGRDIADAVKAKSGLAITRPMVTIHDAFKTIGLFPVTIALHPEVKTDITVNVARTEEEAKIQEKTGKAMIAEAEKSAAVLRAEAEAALKAKQDLMDTDALEADLATAQEEAAEESRKEAESKAKAEKRASKKATAKEEDASEAAEEETAE